MRLLWVELRRLFARRLTRVMLVLGLALVALVAGRTGYDSHRYSPQQLAAAQAEAEQLAAQWRAECRRSSPVEAQPQCDQIEPPPVQSLLYSYDFAAETGGQLVGLAVALGLLGYVVGAGFIGAEWSAGTLAQLLVWEPRRVRVLATKAVALAVGVGLVAAAAMALHGGALYGVGRWRGTLAGTTAPLLRSLALTGGRGALLAVGTALAGFAVAGLLRSTSGALGLGFGYFVAGELAIRNFFPRSQPWLLTSNVAAWLQQRFVVQLPACPTCAGGHDQVVVLTLGRSAAYLGGLVLAALVVCAAALRQRDVT
jgi:hypothetical protein